MVYEAPQSRERVSGREAYIQFNAEGFPGGWHLAVQRIVSQGQTAVSMIEFTEEGTSQTGLCFFDLDDDSQIARITDFWPDPYEPPAGLGARACRYRPGRRVRPAERPVPACAAGLSPRGWCRA